MNSYRPFKIIFRFLIIALVAVALTFAGLITNYGVRQKYSEYRISRQVWKVLNENNSAMIEDLGTVMGVAHKESRFWSAAVGRSREVGVMQISEPLARQYGLNIHPSAPKSTPLQKVLALQPTESQINSDERFREEVNIRISVKNYLRLKKTFKQEYQTSEEVARDLAVLAINLGEGGTKKLLKEVDQKNASSILDYLASENHPADTWFRRAVAISYTEHVLKYRAEKTKELQGSLKKDKPPFNETLINVFESPNEFYTRIFLDRLELERAMKSRKH